MAIGVVVSAILAYGHLAHQVAGVSGLSLAAWMAPVSIVAYAIAQMRPKGDLWEAPLLIASYVILAGVTVPALYMSLPNGQVLVPGTAVFILGVGGLFAVFLAWSMRSAQYLMLSVIYVSAFVFSALRHFIPAASLEVLALYVGLISPVWVAAAFVIKRNPVFGDGGDAVLRQSAGAISMLSCVMGLVGQTAGRGLDPAWLTTLLLAGCIFTVNRFAGGSLWWQHGAFAVFVGAYAVYLQNAFGPPSVRLGDVYLAPVGLYVITMAALARRNERREQYPALFIAGQMLSMTPSLLAGILIRGDIIHVLVLATECVIAVWYGIATRIRCVTTVGTAFLVVMIGLQFHGYTTHIHWAVYATVLGLGIIASALTLERKRTDILRLRKAASEYWESWD